MKTWIKFILIQIFVVAHLSTPSVSRSFDFFYLVQQWPASLCDTKRSCCYPPSGKPEADFGIHGLWPTFKDGSFPSYCDSRKIFNQSEIADLIKSMEKDWPTLNCPSNDGRKFWLHEWTKHGTCSDSLPNQHDYFRAALDLKKKSNLLRALENAGIRPNGTFYNVSGITKAIEDGLGHSPAVIRCNKDVSGDTQLREVYLCVDRHGSNFIECPSFPRTGCGSEIKFPSF